MHPRAPVTAGRRHHTRTSVYHQAGPNAKAPVSIVLPTTTGAARATRAGHPGRGREAGRGGHPRVPVEDGSLTDLAVVLSRDASPPRKSSPGVRRRGAIRRCEGILQCSTDPLVSRDVIGDFPRRACSSLLTQASGTLVKVFGWYDNEWGYTYFGWPTWPSWPTGDCDCSSHDPEAGRPAGAGPLVIRAHRYNRISMRRPVIWLGMMRT